MKIVLQKKKLQDLLTFAKTALPKKEISPILNEFHCTVIDNGHVQIVTTDTDLMAVASMEAKIESEVGEVITIPGKEFISLVSKISADEISLESVESDIYINAGSYSGIFKSLGVEGYPDIRKISHDECDFVFKRVDLYKALTKIQCAVNDDEAKKQLMAVQLSHNGVVSSNGKLTAVYREDFNVDELYISASAVDDLIYVLNNTKVDDIKIFSDESFLVFVIDKDVFFTRRVQVKFPPVFKRIDEPTQKANNKVMTIKLKEFKEVLGRVRLSAPDDSKGIHIKIVSQNEINLNAVNKLGFSGSESLKAELTNFEVNEDYFFNAEYLAEVISHLTDEKFTIALSSNLRMPARIEEGKVCFFLMRLYDNSAEKTAE